jgi:acetolactate synthase-1/3 small subunit
MGVLEMDALGVLADSALRRARSVFTERIGGTSTSWALFFWAIWALMRAAAAAAALAAAVGSIVGVFVPTVDGLSVPSRAMGERVRRGSDSLFEGLRERASLFLSNLERGAWSLPVSKRERGRGSPDMVGGLSTVIGAAAAKLFVAVAGRRKRRSRGTVVDVHVTWYSKPVRERGSGRQDMFTSAAEVRPLSSSSREFQDQDSRPFVAPQLIPIDSRRGASFPMASRRAVQAVPRLLQRQCAAPLQQHRLSSSSSTQALAYKSLHRRLGSLPTDDRPPAWSAQAAVSNILYETPLPSQSPPKKHILNCLVQNEPGVLSRVSGILAARGFNIDSLVVCNTEVDDLSRMTIVLQGQDGVVEQARRQLEDLVPVWAVLDYTISPLVQRELLLAKISILGPEYFEELLAHHREMAHAPEMAETVNLEELSEEDRESLAQASARDSLRKDFHPSNLAVSQALRHKHEHLRAITFMTHQFGGKVLDISTNNCIVEVSAKPTRIESFMKLITPFGILESARTG